MRGAASDPYCFSIVVQSIYLVRLMGLEPTITVLETAALTI